MRDQEEAVRILLANVLTSAPRYRRAASQFAMILYGPPCSGKTALGAPTASVFGAIRVSMDHAHKALLTRDEEITEAASPAMFEVLYTAARLLLVQGYSVICEGVFAANTRRERLTALASTHGAVPIVVRLLAERQELLRRRDERATRGLDSEGEFGGSIISAARLDWFLGLYESSLYAASQDEFVIDTTRLPFNTALDALHNLLSTAIKYWPA